MFLTSSLFYDFLSFLLTTFAVLWAYSIWRYSYWKRKGIQGPKPIFLFGNTLDVITGKITIYEKWANVYFDLKSKNQKHGGVYLFNKPHYIPVDLEIVKEILKSDKTQSHGMYMNENHDPLSAHVLTAEGTRWRQIRSKMALAFLPSKLKSVFEITLQYSDNLKRRLNQIYQENQPVDVKDLLSRYTIDIIGTTAFGLDCNALNGEESEYKIHGLRCIKSQIRFLTQTIVPHWLLDFFKFHPLDPTSEEFFANLVKSTINYREKNDVVRHDFLHMMIQLKNRGILNNDDKLWGNESDNDEAQKFTLNDVIANSFVMFLAGFEPTATTLQFVIYQLAQHEDVQEKAREEIEIVLKKHEKKLTYEAVSNLIYLENVICETLRLFPVGMFPRQCTEDFKIPGFDIVLEKGTYISLPIYGIHYDADYYPDPKKFNPDRFNQKNRWKIPSFAWLPFGEGPRICIGKRFGILQSKLALVPLIRNFKFRLSSRQKSDTNFDVNSITLSLKRLYIDLDKI